jgi:dienelactone hydrolase
MRTVFSLAAALVLAAPAAAAVKTEEVKYTFDGVEFVGYVAYDDSSDANKSDARRPGVLVVHEWWGLNAHAKERARMLAELGYVALACDMYGAGKTVDHPADAQKMATAVRANIDVWRGRAAAALDVLKKHPKVDPAKLAAIGFCFGGSTALQLAYSGADLKAVATFHAALPAPKPAEAKAIKAKILVCHGEADKFISDQSIAAFKKGLADAGVSLTFESYPGVVHSFTAKEADKVGNPGMKYDKAADEKSWASMKKLFAETLGK